MKKYIIIAFSIIAFSSCTYKDIELKSINSVDVQELSKNKCISLHLTLYNPNSYSLIVQDADLDVFIKNIRVGKIQKAEKITTKKDAEIDLFLGDIKIGKLQSTDIIKVRKKSKFTVRCNIIIDQKEILMMGVALIKTLIKKELEFFIKGNITVKRGLIKKQITVNHREKIKI